MTYLEGELTLRRSLEESFSLSSRPARDALVSILRAHSSTCKQAEDVMRNEQVVLDLGDCEIGDDGAEVVADFLKLDDTVQAVWFHNCMIGPRGVKDIAEALKLNETVEELDLTQNCFGDNGAEILIQALGHNVCITCLCIRENDIAPKLLANIGYLTETRNEILIPAAVRRAVIFLIAARRIIANAGILAILPKEIVKLIAMEVYATLKEPVWINALLESERT